MTYIAIAFLRPHLLLAAGGGGGEAITESILHLGLGILRTKKDSENSGYLRWQSSAAGTLVLVQYVLSMHKITENGIYSVAISTKLMPAHSFAHTAVT